MKTKTKITDNLYHVISEPGDHTRYDYMVYKNYDNYSFMPVESTFRFPQRLNIYSVRGIDEKRIREIAEYENCNYYTLLECIRTMEELDANTSKY